MNMNRREMEQKFEGFKRAGWGINEISTKKYGQKIVIGYNAEKDGITIESNIIPTLLSKIASYLENPIAFQNLR